MGAVAIGVDFGTESGRALLVEVATGRELGSSVYQYRNGVIDDRLPEPDDDIRLGGDWALQDPIDYIRTLQHAVPAVLSATGVDPADVIGIGIDFTSCTMLPTTADGTPLCTLPGVSSRPPRLGQALEASRGAAGSRSDQRRLRPSAARPGYHATADGSRRSGSSARASRSSMRRPTSIARPTG